MKSEVIVKPATATFAICFGALVYPHTLLWFAEKVINRIGDTNIVTNHFESIRGLLFFSEALTVSLMLIVGCLVIVKRRNKYLPILFGLSGFGYVFVYRTFTRYPQNWDMVVVSILSDIQTYIVFSSVVLCPALAYWLLVKFVFKFQLTRGEVTIDDNNTNNQW